MRRISYAGHMAGKLIPLGVTGGAVTAVFYCAVFGVVSVNNMLNGFLTGFLIIYSVSYYLSLASSSLRKYPLVMSVFVNSAISFFLVFFISTFINMCFGSFAGADILRSIRLYFGSDIFLSGMLFGAIATLLFFFVREIVLLLGDVTFFRFITGRYHRPRKETLAVMFVDIIGSTSIAEKIGEEKFLSFISEFFCDLAGPVIMTGAEIHKYVGDEAIVVWNARRAFRNNNCIKFYDILSRKLAGRKEHYLQAYGTLPRFRAGLHYGTVVAGEVGNIRKEIAYMGDLFNTAARIVGECKSFNTTFLCSQQVADHIEDSALLSLSGEVTLRGKESPTRLYSLRGDV